MSHAFEGYLERGSTDNLGGRNKKSHPCAIAIPLWQGVNWERENEQILDKRIRVGQNSGCSQYESFSQGGRPRR